MDSGCIIKGCSKSPVKMTHRISSLACFKNMCTASTSLFGEVNSSVQGSKEVFRRSRLAQSYAASNFSVQDRKSTRLNSSHVAISYAVFCLKKKNNISE